MPELPETTRTKLTVPQLARLWGLDTHKIVAWIRSGELRAINGAKKSNSIRPRYLIDVVDIRAFEQAREVIPACPARGSAAIVGRRSSSTSNPKRSPGRLAPRGLERSLYAH